MLEILIREKHKSKVVVNKDSAKKIRKELKKQLRIHKTYKKAKLFSLFNVIDRDGVGGLVTFENYNFCLPVRLETEARDNSILVSIKIYNKYEKCFYVDVMKIGIVNNCQFDVIVPGDPYIDFANKDVVRDLLDCIFGEGSFDYYRYDLRLSL
jgi:hypothetical protein